MAIGETTALRWEPTHVTKLNPRVVPLHQHMSKQPISISRQHRQHPTILIERNPSQQSSFSQLRPRTSSTDSESEHDLEPFIKQSETQQQAFEQHLHSEMSQPTNTTSANQQAPPSTSINPAGILGH